MNVETDISITSTYDESAYRAMAKATWKLFQRHRMQVMAYPALFSIAAVIVILLIVNWNTTLLPIRIGGIAFAILQFAVIPLGARRAQHKTCRKAIRDAKEKGQFPAQVEFLFQSDRIRTKVGNSTTTARYSEVTRLAAVPRWRFLFFSSGAYIIPVSAFSGPEELDHFDDFITGKCGMPMIVLAGKVPEG